MLELSPSDLFPEPGFRYLTDADMEELRTKAMNAQTVELDALTVMRIVCDWRNMAALLENE